MAGAAQTVLAIGQGNQRSAEFLVDTISKGFSQMASATQSRVNMYENFFKSALSLKQQQQDAYFKTKQLELDNKQFELDSWYKHEYMEAYDKKLDNDLEEARIRAEARNNLAKSKDDLDKLRILEHSNLSDRTAVQSTLISNKQTIDSLNKELTKLESIDPVSWHGPRGDQIRNKIEQAENENYELSRKLIQVESNAGIISGSIASINAGSNSKTIMESVNKYINLPEDKQWDSTSMSGTVSEDEYKPLNIQNDSKELKLPNKTISGGMDVTALIPSGDIIKPDVEKKEFKVNSNQLFYTLENPNVTPQARKMVIDKADENAINKLQEAKNNTISSILRNHALSVDYGIRTDASNSGKTFDDTLVKKDLAKFEMYGGDIQSISQLRSQADAKLDELKRASIKDNEPEGINKSKIINGYENWIESLFVKKDSVSNPGVTDLTGRLLDSSIGGNLFGNNVKIPFRQSEKPKVDEFKVEYNLPGFNSDSATKQANILFKEKFIKDGNFNERAFINWTTNPDNKFLPKDFGVSDLTETDSDDFGSLFLQQKGKKSKSKLQIKEDTEQAIKNLAKHPEQALEFFKKYYGRSS